MREKWDELEAFLSEDSEVTAKEFCLTVAVAFLLGLVLGMLFSPKKSITIGSNNIGGGWDDEWEEED